MYTRPRRCKAVAKFFSFIKKAQKQDIAAAVCFAAGFLFLWAYSLYNGTISDESFYITIPLRLLYGDGLFTDEWHLSQLSAVLMYLPAKLFVSITGGTAGIVLFFRRLFCLFQLSVAVASYILLKKSGYVSVITSGMFLLYAALGVRTLSYNTLGVGFFFLLCSLAYSLEKDKENKLKMYFSGALLAAFVLCQPVGIVLYPVYFVMVCVFSLIKKKNTPSYFNFKSLLRLTLGILPVFVFFLYLLLKNSDIATIIKCIPGILSDVEHMKLGENVGIKTFAVFAIFEDMTMAAGTGALIIFAAVLALSLIIKKKSKIIAAISVCVGLFGYTLAFFFQLYFVSDSETDDINFFLLGLGLAGFAMYFLTNKKNTRAFVTFSCAGVLYALFMSISSNLRLDAEANGYLISGMGTLFFASDFVADMKENLPQKPSRIASYAARICVFGLAVFFTVANAVQPTVMKLCYSPEDSLMTDKAFKGIHMPSDQALTYTKIGIDTDKINEITKDGDRVFVLENIPCIYIDGDFGMGAFSGWFIAAELEVSQVRDRFREYYALFPENLPDYVYVPSYMYGETGLDTVRPKQFSAFAYALFDGEEIPLDNGILIRVTGLKNE